MASLGAACLIGCSPHGHGSRSELHLDAAVDASPPDASPPSDPALPPPGEGEFEQGMVSLDFDDGIAATAQYVLPVLARTGLSSTHYIVTGWVGSPGYVSAADVVAIEAAGHEIGAHTRTHVDLTTVSSERRRQEVAGSRGDLLSMGVKSVTTFAYPHGVTSASIATDAVAAGFDGARTTDPGTIARNDPPFRLKRLGMQNGITFDRVRTAIDDAVRDRQWLILVFHHLDASTEEYSVPPALFDQIVAYLVDRRVRVVTTAEGVAQMQERGVGTRERVHAP